MAWCGTKYQKSGKGSVNGAQNGDAVAELGAERVEGLLLLVAAARQLARVILDRVVQEHGAGQVGVGGPSNSRTQPAVGSTARARSMVCHCCI
jgi:hypothetical protein